MTTASARPTQLAAELSIPAVDQGFFAESSCLRAWGINSALALVEQAAKSVGRRQRIVRSVAQVEAILERMATCRVLVVGDQMLDEYLHGEIGRISPEAPVPVLHLHRRESRLGGASNVARNVSALGARVSVFGVVGADLAGEALCGHLDELRIDRAGVTVCAKRPTTRKTRLMSVEHNQQVFRFDEEVTDEISSEQEDFLLGSMAEAVTQADAIICSDYLKGVLTRRVLREVAELGRRFQVPVITAPKDAEPEKYARASVLLPNFREFSRLVNHRKNGNGNGWIDPAALALIKQHDFDALLVTRGKEGMSLFENVSGALSREDIPAHSQAVFDVTGAGDTSIAVFALCLAAGATRSQAAQLANVAAGIVVSKPGTARVTVEELRERAVKSGRESSVEAHAAAT
jgi:rfaE bifunctional protein kinase chain/domain